MVCQHCKGAEDIFGKRYAVRDLREYREQGASQTTELLINTLLAHDISEMTLLDIGGGIGAIPLALLKNGLQSATDVDASSAYIAAAQEEATQQGVIERMNYQHGDFVDIAPNLDAADIVTLDRVVCCYPDMQQLVHLSSERAKRFYALVFPRDNLLTKLGISLLNFSLRLQNNPFRTFVHPTKEIDGIIRGNGLTQVLHEKTWFWQVAVYQRQ